MTELDFMNRYSMIIQQNQTPIVSIDTTFGEVIVPREFVEEDGALHVCIAPEAIRNLQIENDIVYCRVTFRRAPFCLSFPLANVIEVFPEEPEA